MGLIVRFRLFGVDPEFGVTESHVSPAGLVVAVALKFRAVVPSVLVSEIDCSVEVVEPAIAMTLTAPWLTLSSGVLLAVSVTGIAIGVFVVPGTVSVTVPLQVIGVVIPFVFTESTRPIIAAGLNICPVWPAGVIPVAGVAERKPAQFAAEAATA